MYGAMSTCENPCWRSFRMTSLRPVCHASARSTWTPHGSSGITPGFSGSSDLMRHHVRKYANDWRHRASAASSLTVRWSCSAETDTGGELLQLLPAHLRYQAQRLHAHRHVARDLVLVAELGVT